MPAWVVWTVGILLLLIVIHPFYVKHMISNAKKTPPVTKITKAPQAGFVCSNPDGYERHLEAASPEDCRNACRQDQRMADMLPSCDRISFCSDRDRCPSAHGIPSYNGQQLSDPATSQRRLGGVRFRKFVVSVIKKWRLFECR